MAASVQNYIGDNFLVEFGDCECEGTGVLSSWRVNARTFDVDTQTIPVHFSEVEVQSYETAEIEIQTEERDSRSVGQEDSTSRLAAFLDRVSTMIEDQLEINASSRAFEGYTVEADQQESAELLHTLQPPAEVVELGLECTHVSWNAAGTVIAVSYGGLSHEDWCAHRSVVATWSLSNRNINSRKADYVFEVASCVMCVCWHPEQPSVLAAGTFNGEVLIWNTLKEDEPLQGMSPVDDYSHREPITKLAWVREYSGKDHKLVSLGVDGKMLIWGLLNVSAAGGGTVANMAQHRLRHPLGGHHLMGGSRMKTQNSQYNKLMGGTSMSFSPHDRNLCVVGTEAGDLYKCSIAPVRTEKSPDPNWKSDAYAVINRLSPADATDIKKKVDDIAKDKKVTLSVLFRCKPNEMKIFPVPQSVSVFERYSSSVYSLDWSPHHRNVFLSCGAEGSLRLHNALQRTPFLTLDTPATGYLYSASFSPARPLVLAACASDGQIFLYDLLTNGAMPVITLETAEIRRKGAVRPRANTVGFSKKMPYFACGDSDGRVRIWQLNETLSTEKEAELRRLDKMQTLKE